MIYTPGVSFKNTTEDCKSWIYDLETYPESMTSEFNLVCEDDYLITLGQVIFMLGIFFGTMISGFLADIIGRKYVAVGSTAGVLAFGIGAAFSTSFVMFICIRFFVALSVMGLFTVGYVYAIEIIGGKWIEIVGIGAQFNFALGYFTLPLVAYAVPNWSKLQLVITLPIIVIFAIIPFLPESARWLLSKGRLQAATKVLKLYIKINKRIWPEGMELQPVTKRPEEESASIVDLFRTPNMRKNTVIQYYLWFTVAMIYYGLTLNSDSFIPGGNAYINALIGGAIEMLSYVVTILVLLYLGRRILMSAMMFLSGGSLLLVMAVPEGAPALAMASIGRFGIAGAFAIAYLYSVELFPTVIRSTGFGSASMVSRIGSILAPIISRELAKVSALIPLAIFAAFAMGGGLLTLLLPETRGKKLPDTLEEGESFGKGNSLPCCAICNKKNES